MTCNFRVGQKVVCVDDEWGDFGWCGEKAVKHNLHRLPMINEVLTIRLIHAKADQVFLGFHEIPVATWSFIKFRPLSEKQTDISIFKALLTPSKEKVETAS